MTKELIDIVDDNDKVIGQAERSDIYSKQLNHRIVHVLIFNGEGELALQLRDKNRPFRPNCWSTSVGGHVLMGETYEQAALREAREETGTDLKLELFCNDIYIDNNKPNFKKFLTIFKAKYNGPFESKNLEVEKIEFFGIKLIKKMIKNNPNKFHPELLFIISKYII